MALLIDPAKIQYPSMDYNPNHLGYINVLCQRLNMFNKLVNKHITLIKIGRLVYVLCTSLRLFYTKLPTEIETENGARFYYWILFITRLWD